MLSAAELKCSILRLFHRDSDYVETDWVYFEKGHLFNIGSKMSKSLSSFLEFTLLN